VLDLGASAEPDAWRSPDARQQTPEHESGEELSHEKD
jgi:hypothetical protein